MKATMRRSGMRAAALVLGVGAWAACDAGGAGRLTLLATDAPFAHEMVESAIVQVEKIEVHADAGAQSGFQVLFDDPANPIEMDLVQLRDGVTARLVSASVPAGTYRQIRLRFGDAVLRLRNGNEYSTSNGKLQLTSQAFAGLLLFVDPPVEVRDGFSVTLLLDFDLTKSFLPLPADDPENAVGYLLEPVVQVSNLSENGEIRGTVLKADGTSAADATVRARDAMGNEWSTGAGEDGGYVLFVPEGTYDVRAALGDASAEAPGVSVSAGSVTRVDLQLP